MKTTDYRLHVVDALRGFAIVSIMLLHNIEHFDFYFTPENLPVWMVSLDKAIWDTLFFLFGGKSYAIFSLLFGLTFFIQSDNAEKRGGDFRGRFAWRMVLLLLFGIVNSAFYEGDILTVYALIAFFLIPVAKLNTNTVFWIALVLMFQPYEWLNFFRGIQNPNMEMPDPTSWAYFGRMREYVPGKSLLKLWAGNLTNGKTAVLIWTWETGRAFQTLSLFMFGMLAGRRNLFAPTEKNRKFWIRTLIVAAIVFIPLFIVKTGVGEWISSVAVRRPLATIITSWSNMAFMLVLVAGFVLLFFQPIPGRILKVFSPMGRMSLSNYIMQSLMGSFIYYGFGLGLYKYTGASYCVLIGTGLAVIQGYISSWWMKHHKRGPLETLWHKGTWIRTNR